MPVLTAVVAATLLGRCAAVESRNSGDLDVVAATESPSPTPRPRPSRSARPSPSPTPSPIGSWAQLEPEPLPARYSATTIWTGKHLVVWGGHQAQWPNRMELGDDGAMWDPAEESWSPIPPPPVPVRQSSAVAWTGSGLFVWGGTDAGGHRADGAVYEPARGWSRLPGSPLSPRHGALAVASGDEVLVVGGWDNLGALNDGAAFDLRAGEWRMLPPLPPQFGESLRTTTIAGRPAVWAQNSHGEPSPWRPVRYDARRNRWRPALPRTDVQGGSFTDVKNIGGDLYALTAFTPFQVQVLRQGSDAWEAVLTLPEDGPWAQLLVGGSPYLFVVSTTPVVSAHRLDTRTMEWRTLVREPSVWQEIGAAWTGRALLVRGIVSHTDGGGVDAVAPRLVRWRAGGNGNTRRERR